MTKSKSLCYTKKRPAPVNWIFSGLATCCLVVSLSGGVQASQQYDTSFEGNYLAGREASSLRDNSNAAGFYLEALKSDPDNIYLLDNTLQLLINSGSYKQAEDIAQHLYKLEPAHVKAANFLALVAFRNNDFDGVISYLKKSAEMRFGSLSAALLRAWAYAAKKQSTQAIAALDELQANDNLTTFRLLHTALIQDYLGNKKEAETYYKLSYKESAQFVRLVQSYGAFLEHNNRKDEAIKLYQEFLKNNPDDDTIKQAINIAQSSKRKKNKPLINNAHQGAAEAMLNISRAILYDRSTIDLSMVYLRFSLYLYSKNNMAQYQLGETYEELENYEKALAAYRKVGKESPLYTNAVIHVARNLSRLEKNFRARLKLKSHIFGRTNDIRPVFILGDLLRSQERYKDAGKIYSRALRMIEIPEKRHWHIYYYRGISYERTKQWELAEKDFKKALKLMPDQPDVLNYLGYSWVEQKVNLDKAMDMIRKANELRPNNGYIIDSLGWAHYKLGNYKEAVRYLEEATLFKPEDPIINDHLGDAYWKVGRQLEAGFQWNHAKSQLEKRLKEKATEADADHLQEVEKKIEEKSTPYANNLKLKNQAKFSKPL